MEQSFGTEVISNVNEDDSRDKKRDHGKLARLAAGAMAAVVVAGGLSLASSESRLPASQPVAEAEAPEVSNPLLNLLAIEKVMIGGFGDPESRGILDYLSNQGMINHSENNVLVRYPADLAQGELSAEVGSQVAKDAYYAAHNRGNHTIMVGFSQGTMPLARTATELARENGGRLPDDVTIVAYGGPVGENGFWESSFAQVAEPFINFAVPTHDRLPAGSYDVASQNDFWASTGQDTWAGQLAKLTALGVAHKIPAPHEARLAWTGSDGVHYERTDVGVHPWTMLITAQGVHVNEGFNAFFNNIVPVSNGRDPAPGPNSMQAFRGLGRGIDQAMGSQVPVFETLFTFLPHPIIQVGLDVAIKGPDLVVNGLAATVQGVTKGQEGIDGVFNQPVPQGQEAPGAGDHIQTTVETYVGQVIPGFEFPETPSFVPQGAADLPNLENSVLNLDLSGGEGPLQQVVERVQDALTPEPAPAPAPAVVETPPPASVVIPEVTLPPVVEQVIEQVQEVFTPPPAPVVVEAPASAPAPVVVEAPAPPSPAPVVFEAPPLPPQTPEPIVDAVNQFTDTVNGFLNPQPQ